MTKLRIFIASSNEVREERVALEKCINRLNKIYASYDLLLEPVMWESETKEFTRDRKQDAYNEALVSSDVVIFLFGSRVGEYTREEFELTINKLKENEQKRHIFVFFKNIAIDTCNLNDDCMKGLQDILQLKEYIAEDLNQVYTITFSEAELLIKISDEIHRVALPFIAHQPQIIVSDEKLTKFIKLFSTPERAYESQTKRTIIDNASLDLYILSNFNIAPRKRKMSEKEFYEHCQKTLDATQYGANIKALSMMLKCEWTNTHEEQEFWQANLRAVKRGVKLERIFIVKKNEAHRLHKTPQILNHIGCKDGTLEPYIIEEEALEKTQPDLLRRAGQGFLLIKDTRFKIALLDSDPASDPISDNRGEPCIDENKLSELEDLFTNIKALATPLKNYLKAIPRSHCKKEMLSIFVTTKCNLSCDYCFTNKNVTTHKSKTIEFEFVKHGIDEYFKTDYLRHIRFFGAGEPTEEFELLKKIHYYAKEKGGKNVTFEIQTNGAFNSVIAKWLAKNIDIIWISCDGTPDIQNAHRPFLNGHQRKTSDVIEQNIREMKKDGEGFSTVGIRATITNENVNNQLNLIDYFKGLGINYIWVDPVFPSVGEKAKTSESTFDVMHFAKNFLEACKYAEKSDIFYGSILTCNFADNVTKHCRACTPVPHLTTDGYVSACDMALFGEDKNHMDPFIYGKWNDTKKQIEYDNNKIDMLRSRNIDNEKMQHCSTCPSREHCGGYCLGEVLNEKGTLFGQKEKVCEAIKFLDTQMSDSQRAYLYTHP